MTDDSTQGAVYIPMDEHAKTQILKPVHPVRLVGYLNCLALRLAQQKEAQ
jgi:hypothetical protein